MYKCLINNEEVIVSNNITIKEEFLNTSSVILNNVYPATWEEDKDYVSRFYFPRDYNQVELYNDETLVFSGILKKSGSLVLNPFQGKFGSFEALDYKTLLSEGKNLDFVISNKTVTEAISMVVDAVADYGFAVGNIQIANPNEIIGAYSTLDQSPFDVLQYLSEISGSLWTTRNENGTTYVDFYDIENLAIDDDIEYTQQYFEKNKIKDMYYSFSTDDYRNKQEIVSDNVYASNSTTETVFANGYDNSYIVSQNIGNINSITVNGVQSTIITKDEKDVGKTAEYYYEPNKNMFYKFDDLPLDLVGTRIVIDYVPIIKGRAVAVNIEEITRISNSLNRNGTITRYENRNDLLMQSQLANVAQTYLKFKGKPEITLTVKTKNNDILTLGHKVHFNINIPELMLLNTDYLVKSKQIDIIQGKEEINTFYTYTLSSNFNAENQINYFDNQRRKAQGNIDEGSFIDRNIDLIDSVNLIFKNLNIEEVS